MYLCIIGTIVYTIEAKCWFRFLLDLKHVPGPEPGQTCSSAGPGRAEVRPETAFNKL